MDFQPLFDYPVTGMKEDVSNVFLMMYASEVQGDDELVDSLKQLENFPLYKVFSNQLRSNGTNIHVSKQARLFLFFMIHSTCPTPAVTLMYAYTLKYALTFKKLDRIDMTALAELFPDGFPSEETLDKAYDDFKRLSEC